MKTKSPAHASLPIILYGTAWKEDNTETLVTKALSSGFRGIDTANQRKHYFEQAVGIGIEQFLKNSKQTRADLFLQTKFTSIEAQDSRLPYDPFATLTEQVQQSFASSLIHLQTDYIDSYILHGPTASNGLTTEDYEIWQAMENLVKEKKVTYLGISNVSLQQLEQLYASVSIKPCFVQNRCFAISKWDQNIRAFCKQNNIIYQGFSLLTANQSYLLKPVLASMASKYGKTIAQIVFRFASQIGILPLTGTSNSKHMQEDLSLSDFELSSIEMDTIEHIAV